MGQTTLIQKDAFPSLLGKINELSLNLAPSTIYANFYQAIHSVVLDFSQNLFAEIIVFSQSKVFEEKFNLVGMCSVFKNKFKIGKLFK